MEKTAIKQRQDGRCPYCHETDLSGQNYSACGGCGAKQHKRCWEDHGACAACGNTQVVAAPPIPAPQATQIVKRGIPPSKLIMGVIILAAMLACAILIPGSRYFIAAIAFFGAGDFLSWLDR